MSNYLFFKKIKKPFNLVSRKTEFEDSVYTTPRINGEGCKFIDVTLFEDRLQELEKE